MENKSMQRLTNIEEQFIEKFVDNMRTFGVSTTVGRVLGIIYMNREPMNLDELSEATGMSKTRMSQVVREMVELNIGEKVFEKGARKDLYNVEQDYYQTFISLLTSNWRKTISKNKIFKNKLDQELADIEEDSSMDRETEEKLNKILEETEIWVEYYDWISRVMDFFESGEIFKYVPKYKDKKHDYRAH